MIYVISDTHFGHEKMKQYCDRPDGFEWKIISSLERLELKSLHEKNTIIHLGDICIGRDEYWNTLFCSNLHSLNKILVRGNHDLKSNTWYLSHGWDTVCDQITMTINGKRIIFSHTPVRYNKHKADLNIHGHLHLKQYREYSLLERFQKRNYKLISLEIMGYRPFTVEEILNNYENLVSGH